MSVSEECRWPTALEVRFYFPHAFCANPARVPLCMVCGWRFQAHPYWEEELADAILTVKESLHASLASNR